LTIGFNVPTVEVNPFKATFVPGAVESVLSAPITCCSRELSGGVRRSTVVPTSIAGLISGNAARNSALAGVKLRPNDAKSLRNGCWIFSDVVDTLNVDGDFAIVDSNAPGLFEIAANVVAISVNSCEFTFATGATTRMN
jgi:hypothetical protein